MEGSYCIDICDLTVQRDEEAVLRTLARGLVNIGVTLVVCGGSIAPLICMLLFRSLFI